ncbi:MAG TPA: replication-associated recombination protein A [Thermoanaerobaculia bacterium]|jgi:putative ATPase|nr:replication-associated recombination protein A [Thermoanaerobaculia bacterium]
MTGSLFNDDDFPPPSAANNADTPLAERLRPKTLDDVVGLEDLLGEKRFLRNAIETDRIPSMIFWGPPGSGKTTVARIIAKTTRARFVQFSATSSSIKDIKTLMEEARRARQTRGSKTIVFIDEIHRFNKAQQDAFLPYVEAGDIILIGATTENPSFEVNSALLSRSKVVVIPALEREQVMTILRRAVADPSVEKYGIALDDAALDFMAATSAGDARQALTSLQLVVETASHDDSPVSVEKVKEILQRRSLMYDKSGDEHYNIISALHKSIRNGDADAAVYWLVRMLEGGEDPMYIARRLVRAASEDIGNADPQALVFAIAVQQTVHFIGMPEGGVALAQLVTYLAASPKSNAAYIGYGEAVREVRQGDNPGVPLHIRNAPTRLMKDLGYGRGYQYAHDFQDQTAAMECLPEALLGRRFYEPKDVGVESEIRERLEKMRKARKT